MIGVIARDGELATVREFFELFKTPWEPWNPEKAYDAVLSTTGEWLKEFRADLVLVYAGKKLASDPEDAIEEKGTDQAKILQWKGREIPLFGKCIAFPGGDKSALAHKELGQPAALWEFQGEQQKILRVGYDLFEEVRFLLSIGQPVAQAGIPTLDLHIEFLRDQLCAADVAFVEIPPVPEGYRFIACLTHDVDHPSLRKHRWDHTALGFLYRATIGSLLSLLRGRISASTLVRNWTAAAKWPFVQLGLAKDFWDGFDDRYAEADGPAASTYFVIPFAGMPGIGVSGSNAKHRASGYGARDIEPAIRKILKNGNEVGLHGIDAWTDSKAGARELDEIRSLTGKTEIGVRMHWLCFDERSPKELERAGASYDSTVGYRETVGYRAGTTQAYLPPGAEHLLELPLHVMDTALFYPAYLHLTPREAIERMKQMIMNAVHFGGCITINWHDRSIAPERCWDGFYAILLEELQQQGAWFGNAAQSVAWFRKRRTAQFDTALGEESKESPIGSQRDVLDDLPSLKLRVVRHAKEQTISCQA